MGDGEQQDEQDEQDVDDGPYWLRVPTHYLHLFDELTWLAPAVETPAGSTPGKIYVITAHQWPAMVLHLQGCALVARWQASRCYLVQQDTQVGGSPGEGTPMTSGGVELTEGRLAELVAEAEAGYDVDQLQASGRHRLKAGHGPDDDPGQGDDWVGDAEHVPPLGKA